MRYTEARLARLATEMLRDIDADTVDFGPNYDESRKEPLVLPSRFPNLLVNGSSGIAVGMATNIPPHNLREAIDAVVAYIDDPTIDVQGLMKHIKGPDFPTGGIIVGRGGIREAYETGRGRVVVRGQRAHRAAAPGQGGDHRHRDALPGLQGRRARRRLGPDQEDRRASSRTAASRRSPTCATSRTSAGIRLVIELKRDAIPKVVLNKLYKHTPLQTTFGVNMVALVDGVPRTLGLLPIVTQLRRPPARRDRAAHQARAARARRRGCTSSRACSIALARPRRGDRADPRLARPGHRARRPDGATSSSRSVQAQAILDLRLARLTALEADKIKQEHADLLERIKELREILGDEARVMALIKEELLEIKERYGDERRTEITHSEDEIDIEDLIADQQMVIAITQSGYIKSLPLATYRQQKRGGVGVTGMDMKDDDYIEHLFVCSTHDFLLFFTNRGKVYRQKVYELPEASRTAKGRALVNVLPLREGECVQAVQATRDFSEGKYLVFATRKGQIKKTEFGAYNTPIKADGIIAIKIRDDDELVAGPPDRAATTTSSWSRARARRRASTRTRCGRWAATPAASRA